MITAEQTAQEQIPHSYFDDDNDVCMPITLLLQVCRLQNCGCSKSSKHGEQGNNFQEDVTYSQISDAAFGVPYSRHVPWSM